MPVQPGQALAQYRLVEKIGEGGMGVVWKAVDTSLDREVAIKILPEAVAADAERMARFEREAKLLASLNHTNIATVYGLHESDPSADSGQPPTRFIAMEFVPGEDLAERLTRGPMPLDEATEVTRQIADALEAAHERGVIHRDLKPANVRLTGDGTVKVLDFGLAKSFGEKPGDSFDSDLSPTLTSDRTRDGVILGTAAYMSPEQARGRHVDRRSDVWAFGCLLYECLTGSKAFPGETISDTLAAVLKSEPKWAALPDTTPDALRRLLRRCMAKDPKRRLRSPGDAKLELDEATDEESRDTTSIPTRGAPRWLPWIVLPLAAAAVTVALAYLYAGRATPNTGDAVAYTQLTHQRGGIGQACIAPDGQTVLYSASWDGRPMQLFLQRLDSTDAVPVALEPAHARVLSISSRGEVALLLPADPDGELMGTPIDVGILARVPITGGAPRALAENVRTADWDPTGEQLALVRAVENGRQLEYPVEQVLYRTLGDIGSPEISPTGELVAFFDHPLALNNRGSVAVVNSGGEVRRLTGQLEWLVGLAWSPDGSEIWFSGLDDIGYALFAVDLAGELRVLRRSPDALALYDVTPEGDVLVAHSLFHLGVAARAAGESSDRDLSWMGKSWVTDLSTDGTRVLFTEQQMDYDVWLRGVFDSAPTRLGPGMSFTLSPDGRWALASLLSPDAPLTLLPTGAGKPRELPGKTGVLWAAWTPDGKRVVLAAPGENDEPRLYVQDVEGGQPRPISDESVQAVSGMKSLCVSPDGRWVSAKAADGALKLYPIDGAEPREVPGALPEDLPLRWTSDGRALFVTRGIDRSAQVYRLDIESGERELWRDLAPPDPAGIRAVIGAGITPTPDGEGYAYTYVRSLSTLYLLKGLD